MSFLRYPEYKATSHDWLGNIPVSWSVNKFRHLFAESSEKIESEVYGEMLSVSGYRGIEIKEYSDENQKRTEENLVGYRIVHDGQLVVNTMWLNYAGLGISNLEGHVSPAYRAYWVNPSLHKPFVHYLMRSSVYVLGYTKYLTGVRPNSLQMGKDDLMSFPIVIPSLNEQKIIASFLDEETSKINKLIEEQEKLISLLKEKRQAIISQTVTKGLNSEAKMKNSGIDWIGSIPENWTLIPFRYCVDYSEGPGIMAVDFQMSGVPLIRISGVGERWVKLDGCNYLDPEVVAKKWAHFSLKSRDLLISASASMGTVSEVNEETAGAIPYTGLIRLRPKTKNITRDFIRAFVVSSMFSKQIDELKTGATIQHFGPTHLSQIKMVLPSILEQEKITSYLDKATKEYDDLITETQNSLRLLDERRSALISEAVTGKINVSNYQTSEIA